MTIPAIIVPILTEPERLDALLASIDHPVGRVVVIDNGGVVDASIGGRALMPFVVHVVKPGWNLGVAASWNLGIKCWPLAPWWAVVSHDITFGPGDLARLDAAVEPRANAVYYLNGMAAFAVTPPALHEVGWFEEGIVPAYDEDLDWQRRARLIGTREVEVGYTGTHAGSATIRSDPRLRAANARSHLANDAFYAEKWGGAKDGHETFDRPWGNGRIQETRPDINRLRENTWPRKEEQA